MFKSKNFTSISSDHNLFDLDLMFARILKELNLSEKQFAVKVRAYFQAKLSYMSELELANAVSNFLTRDLDYMTFLETMDILGMAVELKVTKIEKVIPEHEPDAAGTVPTYPAIYDALVSALDLSARPLNCLRFGCQIEYIGHLVSCTEDFILKGVGVGPTALMHIKAALAKEGLALGTDVGDWKSPAEKNLAGALPMRCEAPAKWDLQVDRLCTMSPATVAYLQSCGVVYVGDLIRLSREQFNGIMLHVNSSDDEWLLTNAMRNNSLRLSTNVMGWVRPVETPIKDESAPKPDLPAIWNERLQDKVELSPLLLAHLKACGMVYVGDLIQISYDQCTGMVRGIGGDTEVWELISIVRDNGLLFSTDVTGWVRPTN